MGKANTSQNKKNDKLKNLYNTYIAMHICIHQFGIESNHILIFWQHMFCFEIEIIILTDDAIRVKNK